MKNFILLGIFLLCLTIQAQKNEVFVQFLKNENIVDVNINQDAFLKNFEIVQNTISQNLAIFPSDKPLAIIIDYQTDEEPYVIINAELEKSKILAEAIAQIPVFNTNYTNFPVLLIYNATNAESQALFKQIRNYGDFTPDFIDLSIEDKYNWLRHWAEKEIVPILAAYEAQTDAKFLGVKKFGMSLQSKPWKNQLEMESISIRSEYYWRANMEMNLENPLIPTTYLFMLVSQGKLDYVRNFLSILLSIYDKGSIPFSYLQELDGYIEIFFKDVNVQIEEGISFHDQNKYSEALSIYENLLKEYPHSAWAIYEVYYSKFTQLNNKENELWYEYAPLIYNANPLYHMTANAQSKEEAYKMYVRLSLNKIFQSNKPMNEKLYEFADSLLDLEIYDLAAHLYWIVSPTLSNEKLNRKALSKHLYCLEKLGVTTLKEVFKGNYEKEFKEIEKERKEIKENNTFYQSMK